MVTDNDPRSYKYVSLRLARSIVEQHEGARPHYRWKPQLEAKFVSLGLQGVGPDYGNRADLARRATESVRDNIGTIAFPGTYIAGVLPMEACRVAFHLGFEGTGRQEVASYFADINDPEAGRVFVALFGSLHNVIGWRAGDKLSMDRFPSDAAGLYDLLWSTLEPRDAVIDRERLDRDRDLETHESFDAAYGVAYRHDEPLRISDEYEFLAKVHVTERDITLDHTSYDVAVLGSPIWVATRAPRRSTAFP